LTLTAVRSNVALPQLGQKVLAMSRVDLHRERDRERERERERETETEREHR
jgi:hypothetical protein